MDELLWMVELSDVSEYLDQSWKLEQKRIQAKTKT